MALELHIPACKSFPAQPYHLPQLEQPLRIQIEGPLVSVEKLLPGTEWQLKWPRQPYLQPTGVELAKIVYRVIYGQDVRSDVVGDMVVRDEYLGWVTVNPRPLTYVLLISLDLGTSS